jgi:hypothetical protein
MNSTRYNRKSIIATQRNARAVLLEIDRQRDDDIVDLHGKAKEASLMIAPVLTTAATVATLTYRLKRSMRLWTC